MKIQNVPRFEITADRILYYAVLVLLHQFPLSWSNTGSCRNVEEDLDPNLDLLQMQGLWYQYASLGGPCEINNLAVDFKVLDPFTLGFQFDGLSKETDTGERRPRTLYLIAKGTLTTIDCDMKRKLNATFHIQEYRRDLVRGFDVGYTYLLNVDYKHYSVWWTCQDFTYRNIYIDNAWIFTRDRALRETDIEESVRNRFWADLKKFGYSKEQFSFSNQSRGSGEINFIESPVWNGWTPKHWKPDKLKEKENNN